MQSKPTVRFLPNGQTDPNDELDREFEQGVERLYAMSGGDILDDLVAAARATVRLYRLEAEERLAEKEAGKSPGDDDIKPKVMSVSEGIRAMSILYRLAFKRSQLKHEAIDRMTEFIEGIQARAPAG